MIGELPVSVAPAIVSRNPYTTAVILDGAVNCGVQYGVAEVYGWSSTDRVPKVRRPTADSLLPPRLAIFPGAEIDASADLRINAADFSQNTLPVLVAVDASSTAPALGDSIGTLADSWAMKVGNTGFVVTGVVSTSLVYIRPAGGGGGGGGPATLLVVQATADGSAGVVPAKTMTFKADVSASPNYDLATDAVNYNYFRA